MAVVAISNSATKASGTRHLWLASSSRRVGEWKGMHVSGTGLGSASGADIAAAFSHRLIVSRGITLQFAHRIDPDAAGDTTPAALAGSAAWRRSEEHTSELQSLMRISSAVF